MRTDTKSRLALATALVAVAVVAAPKVAFAEGEGATQPAPQRVKLETDGPTETTRWYGYQTLIADGAATSFFLAGISTFRLCLNMNLGGGGSTSGSCDNGASSVLLATGSIVYLLGGPTFHAANGHWDKAGYSLGLRALPVATGIALSQAGAESAGGLMLVGGVLAAMVVDSAVLAKETVVRPSLPVSVVPSYEPRSHTAAIVVSGAF